MASISFTCPHCDKVLRTSARPAAGKKIKCPACGDAFVPDVEDEETGVQEKPSARTKSSSKTNASGASAKKPRHVDDDDEDDYVPRKKSDRARDDDEDEDDERPAKKSKKAKKKSGSMMSMVLLILAGGGVFLGLGACVFGAFVWPGFLNSDDKRAQPQARVQDADGPREANVGGVFNSNNIADFVSPQSAFLVGINTKSLRDRNLTQAVFTQLDKVQEKKDKIPPEYLELFRNSDKILVSSMESNGKPAPVIGVLAPSEVVGKFKMAAKLGQEEMLAGKYRAYRQDPNNRSLPNMVVITGDRSVLMADLNDQETIQLLDPAYNKQVKPCQAVLMSRTVDQNEFWAAWAFDDYARQLFNDPGEMAKQIPQAQEAAQALQRAKGGTLAISAQANASWNIRVQVDCNEPNDAKTIKEAADAGRATLSLLLAFGGAGGKAPSSALKDFNSIKIENVGTSASLTAQVSAQTIAELSNQKGFDPKKDLAANPPKDFKFIVPKDFAKDLAAKDAMKDFMAKDRKPLNKDLAKDGAPMPKDLGKDLPMKDGGKTFGPVTLSTGGLPVDGKRELPFKFQQGRNAFIRAQVVVMNKKTETRLELLQGQTGDMVVAQGKSVGTASVIEYMVPASDVYRVRITNLGPGVIFNAQVFVVEK